MKKKLLKISKYRPSIFQGKFEFSDYGRDLSLALEHPLERVTRQVLLPLVIISISGYLYFVAASVLNVIARKEALSNSASVQGSIGSLEQRYLELERTVTVERGQALGLASIPEVQYVYRPGAIGAVPTATIGRNDI